MNSTKHTRLLPYNFHNYDLLPILARDARRSPEGDNSKCTETQATQDTYLGSYALAQSADPTKLQVARSWLYTAGTSPFALVVRNANVLGGFVGYLWSRTSAEKRDTWARAAADEKHISELARTHASQLHRLAASQEELSLDEVLSRVDELLGLLSSRSFVTSPDIKKKVTFVSDRLYKQVYDSLGRTPQAMVEKSEMCTSFLAQSRANLALILTATKSLQSPNFIDSIDDLRSKFDFHPIIEEYLAKYEQLHRDSYNAMFPTPFAVVEDTLRTVAQRDDVLSEVQRLTNNLPSSVTIGAAASAVVGFASKLSAVTQVVASLSSLLTLGKGSTELRQAKTFFKELDQCSFNDLSSAPQEVQDKIHKVSVAIDRSLSQTGLFEPAKTTGLIQRYFQILRSYPSGPRWLGFEREPGLTDPEHQRARCISYRTRNLVQKYHYVPGIEHEINSIRNQSTLPNVDGKLQIYLDGPPGTGKTFFVEQLSLALDVPMIKVTVNNGGDLVAQFRTTKQNGALNLGDLQKDNHELIGRIPMEMTKYGITNPIIFFDELGEVLRPPAPGTLDFTYNQFAADVLRIFDTKNITVETASDALPNYDIRHTTIIAAGNYFPEADNIAMRWRRVKFPVMPRNHKVSALNSIIARKAKSNVPRHFDSAQRAEILASALEFRDFMLTVDEEARNEGLHRLALACSDLFSVLSTNISAGIETNQNSLQMTLRRTISMVDA